MVKPAQPLPWASHQVARAALLRYPAHLRGRLRCLNVAENATFRVDGQHGPWALRLYRPNRWTEAQIRVEHAFMAHLDPTLHVAPPIPGLDRDTLQTLDPPGTFAAAFAWAPGHFVQKRRSPRHIDLLAAWFARAHDDATTFHPETDRHPWDVDTLLVDAARRVEAAWNARDDLGPCPIAPLTEALLERWHAAERPAGFIHADLHFGNVRFAGPHLHPIDFDDCGHAPLAYDLCIVASTVHSNADWIARLAHRYAADARHPVTTHDIELFVAVRQIAMMGWIFDRPEIFSPERQQEILQFILGRARTAAERLGIDAIPPT